MREMPRASETCQVLFSNIIYGTAPYIVMGLCLKELFPCVIE